MISRIWTGQDKRAKGKSALVTASLVALVESTGRVMGHKDCYLGPASSKEARSPVPSQQYGLSFQEHDRLRSG